MQGRLAVQRLRILLNYMNILASFCKNLLVDDVDAGLLSV
jgi:hypothetical protein